MAAPMSMDTAELYGSTALLPPYKAKKPTSRITLATAFVMPIVVFIIVHSVLSFSLYYNNKHLAHFFCAVCLAAVLGVSFFGYSRWRASLITEREASWFAFLFVTGIAAWVFALCFGKANFMANSQSRYQVSNMNTYEHLSPSGADGQQFMDLGKVQFIDEAHVDVTRSMSFTNRVTYCVAPVITGERPTGIAAKDIMEEQTDFWAVGINCCGGHTEPMECPYVNDRSITSAVRVVDEPDVDFFRLAVQQATAAHNVKTRHPIFVRWTKNMDDEIRGSGRKATENFVKGFLGFGVAQFIAWILFTILAARQ